MAEQLLNLANFLNFINSELKGRKANKIDEAVRCLIVREDQVNAMNDSFLLRLFDSEPKFGRAANCAAAGRQPGVQSVLNKKFFLTFNTLFQVFAQFRNFDFNSSAQSSLVISLSKDLQSVRTIV